MCCSAGSSDGADDGEQMSDSQLMREMFRLEKILQEGGPTSASASPQPVGDGELGMRIKLAITGAAES